MWLLANEQGHVTEAITTWANIWLGVVIVGSAIFFCILVYCVIAGAGDIKSMFAALKKAEDEAKRDAESQAPSQSPTQHADSEAEARK